jgi:hypothetical protein
MAAGALVVMAAGGCTAERQAARRDAAREYTDRICRLAGDDAIMPAAVDGFIDGLQPRVRRFAYIPGTDSSPPPAAIQALQDRGPTYLYSTDPAQQATVERQLDAIGDFPTLLVVYHGLTKQDALRPVVRLSGRYISGTGARGTVIGVRAITSQCDSTGTWRPVPAAGGR